MAVYRSVEYSGIYFLTFACYKRLPLFEPTESFTKVYKFFGCPTKRVIRSWGYTIHAVVGVEA